MNQIRKPIKLCMIITDAISFNTLCRGQLEYFQDSKEFDITLICGGDDAQIKILKERHVGNVVRMPLVRQPNLFKDIKCLIQLWTYFLFNRFDLIVYSTPKALLLGSIASFFSFQSKRIALIRGRVYENYVGKKRKIFSFVDKICLFFSHKALFISKSLQDIYLKENLVNEKKMMIIHHGSSNGVDTKKFTQLDYQPKSNYFRIIIMGRICHDKGIFELESIIEKIKNLTIQITIVGKVEDQQSQDKLNSLLAHYDFLEYVQHTTEPVSYFQNADLHLFLSHREGFGNVALEAASCGVPTFAYDVVGIKDSVKDSVSGLKFGFKDTDAIADAIHNAVANPQEFKKQYSQARIWVLKNFEQKTVWMNYMQSYIAISEGKI